MKIAYFIMAHHKLDQLLTLLNTVYDETNIYLIHIDSKAAADMHDLVANLADSNENVHVLPSRSVAWACWSLVQLEIDAIKHLLAIDKDWNYYINLSGQDMPLVKQERIKALLTAGGNDRNYLAVNGNLDSYAKEKFSQYWVEDFGILKKLGPRLPFSHYFSEGISIYNGTQWKMINRQFAEYAVTSSFAFDLQDYFRYTFMPDELYFQTLIMNSSFKGTVVNNHYRYLKMEKRDNNMFFRPKTITIDLLVEMYASNALFARKFDSEVDANVIKMIENTIFE